MVTASGKVIETETELLQKKIEKKREEAKQSDSNLAVAQEIKEKEEAVKKEYVFPPTTLLKKGAKNAAEERFVTISEEPLRQASASSLFIMRGLTNHRLFLAEAK